MLFAASQGDTDALRTHLAAGVDLYQGDYDNRTAVHLAASEGHVDTVTFLVSIAHRKPNAFARIDQKDRWGATALDNAVENGQSDVAYVLRDAGLAPSENRRAPPAAAESKHGSADAESSEHGQGSDSAGVSIYAAATGDLDHLIALSAARVDLGAADYERRTALHLAASNGHLAIVRYLLAQAVSESTATRSLAGWLAARDRFGNTAADDAARGLHVELLQLLADAARM